MLNNTEQEQLKLGFEYSFIVKTHQEKLARLRNLRGYMDIFTKNIMNTKDFTCHKLRSMTNTIDIVVLKGYKDSSLLVMDQ